MANSDSRHSLEYSHHVRSNTLFEEPSTTTDAFLEKLENDIAFLRDRIQRMEEQRTNNSISLRTYQHMLDDRLKILSRMRTRNS